MMYRVIKMFTDLQDNDYPYNAGDVYPRQGMTVTAERIAELASPNNRQNTPLIEAVDETAADVAAEETAGIEVDGEQAETAEIEEKPKRKRRKADAENETE